MTAEPQAAPQQLEAEESVLGACMLSEGAIAATSEHLRPEDFYRTAHGVIYRAILSLYSGGEGVDWITVTAALERDGKLEAAGGKARVAELSSSVGATANAAHYARIVHGAAVLRRLHEAGDTIARAALDQIGEPTEQLEQAEQLIFNVSLAQATGGIRQVGPAIRESFDRMSARYESGAELTGVSSGFRGLDKLTAGFQPGNLVIVAARPSMGKTGLALSFALHLALHEQQPVAVFSLEMSETELVQRMLAMQSNVDGARIKTGRLSQEDWPRLAEASRQLFDAPIYVDDRASLTLLGLRSEARRLKLREPGLALVIVDYLQLMTAGTNPENRTQEVSQISRALKVLARDLEIPVVALSQLNRSLETRSDKRPILSDLRESGSIEQDADLVGFIYRDDYYNKESGRQGLAEFILAKHRNGPTDTVELHFRKSTALFTELEQVRPANVVPFGAEVRAA